MDEAEVRAMLVKDLDEALDRWNLNEEERAAFKSYRDRLRGPR